MNLTPQAFRIPAPSGPFVTRVPLPMWMRNTGPDTRRDESGFRTRRFPQTPTGVIRAPEHESAPAWVATE
ncbi:hypothetical protein GCM10023212_36990 [Luteolibacter yonseiensis]